MPEREGAYFEERELWSAGEGEYHTYRIPAMVVATTGSILAFCEGRKFHSHDGGKIDLLLKRSSDGGQTWTDTDVVVEDGDTTCANPCPVVDETDGTIWLPFCKSPRDDETGGDLIVWGKSSRTHWITCSRDDGVTWAEPTEITSDVRDLSWTSVATGPGHGIQLSSGRLIVPCHHMVGVDFEWSDPSHSHLMLSDDHGSSWRIGGILNAGTGESAVVETADGAIYINCRNQRDESLMPYRRARAWSYDAGESFTEFGREDVLIEPSCEGSLVRFTKADRDDRSRVLFANPASTEGPDGGHSGRRKMTVRVSYDECRTWPVARLVHAGPSAYSDMAVAPDKTICLLYERSDSGLPYKNLTLARFDIEWVTGGEDRLG